MHAFIVILPVMHVMFLSLIICPTCQILNLFFRLCLPNGKFVVSHVRFKNVVLILMFNLNDNCIIIVFRVTIMCMEVQMASIHFMEQMWVQLVVVWLQLRVRLQLRPPSTRIWILQKASMEATLLVRAMVCTHTISTSIRLWILPWGTRSMVPQSPSPPLHLCNLQV